MGILTNLFRAERHRPEPATTPVARFAADEAEAELDTIRELLEVTTPLTVHRAKRSVAPNDPIQPLPDARAMLDDILRRFGTRAQLVGSAEDVAVDTLLHLVHADALSGRLWIRTESELLSFDIRAGSVTRAGSQGSQPANERLGEILVEMGAISTDDVQQQLQRIAGTDQPFGVGLLASGRIQVQQLRDALQRQSSARFARALSATRAGYAFYSSNATQL